MESNDFRKEAGESMGEGRSEREKKHKGLLSHSRREIGPGSPLPPFLGKEIVPFERAMVVSYRLSTVTIALSLTIRL